MILNWNVSKEEHDLIVAIAQRAAKLSGVPEMMRETLMDVTAAHANGNPLRLAELLAADDFNFAHDVFGLATHLNRNTGRLEHCFVPRYTAPQGEAK